MPIPLLTGLPKVAPSWRDRKRPRDRVVVPVSHPLPRVGARVRVNCLPVIVGRVVAVNARLQEVTVEWDGGRDPFPACDVLCL